MDKVLSISVAAYNAEKYIEKCLDSFCVPEIIDNIEVLIVNDGSTDRTAEIAARYASRYPDTFILINKENGGHGSTINAAILRASGKYFKIVDADDWIEGDGLIQLVEALKKYDVDVVLSPYYFVDAKSEEKTLTTCLEKQEEMQNQILSVETMDRSCHLAMHAITYRTSILQENFLPLDEKCFYVDLEYIVFYFRHVKKVFVSEFPVYDYLIGTDEQSVNMHNMVKRREQHLRVCKRLFSYYGNKQSYIDSLIENCVLNEYRILFEIKDSIQSKKEMLQFDTTLKEASVTLYKHTVSNGVKEKKQTAMLVFLMRLIHFYGYKCFHGLIHLL